MPSVKEIHLVCTPEEWEVLCKMVDAFDIDGLELSTKEFEHEQSLRGKVSAINKRLIFASSMKDK